MANNYYGNRGQGAHLRHYRTKGSKNGVSKDPNYRPVGDKAVGRIINGRYVYEQVANNPFVKNLVSAQKQNYLKRQADASYARLQAKRPTNVGVDKLAAKAEQQARARNAANESYNSNMKKKQMAMQVKAASERGAANNWQERGNAMASTIRAINNYGPAGHVNTAYKQTLGVGKSAYDPSGYKDVVKRAGIRETTLSRKAEERARQNASNQAAAERAGREAATQRASEWSKAESTKRAHQNAVNQAQQERYAKNRALYRSRKFSGRAEYGAGTAKSAHNSAVNQANAERAARESIVAKNSAASAHRNAVNQHNAEQEARNKIYMKQKVKNASAEGAKRIGYHSEARDRAYGMSDDYRNHNAPWGSTPSRNTNGYSPYALGEGFYARQSTADKIKRAANVSMVNTKKKLQKTGAKIAEQAPVYADKVAKKASQYANDAKKATAAAASNLAAKGKNTVDSILKKLKKKKK